MSYVVGCRRGSTSSAARAALLLSAISLSVGAAMAQSDSEKETRIRLEYAYCFADGKELVYGVVKVRDVAECSKRCEADDACAAFEIWEHTKNCKLYSALPKSAPRPQTVFPNNKLANNQQAQAAIGIKIRRGF
jgi:hypothetical protein